MTPNAISWEVPGLSTTSVEAAIHYRDGIAALVAGIANAERLLAAATTLDPGFLLAHIGLAVVDVTGGGDYAAPRVSAGVASRGERQHAEVVAATFGPDCHRARDLRREHLLECPGDVLIVWLPALARDGAG
jgi:hypothetical protein